MVGASVIIGWFVSFAWSDSPLYLVGCSVPNDLLNIFNIFCDYIITEFTFSLSLGI
jgi:hypothetical protein